MARSIGMDMTSGPLFGKIIRFTIPVMLSGILQLLFNAADLVVVGRFAGSTALAAVGSTGALTNLIVNLFIGLSVGANVIVAQYFGARDHENIHQTVHTAITVSIAAGLVLTVVGIILAYPLLEMMGTPKDVIDQSALYMRIYFAGMIVTMPYNFGSAILRAIGDTKRPLYFLAIAGVLNVCMNLIFVIVFHMGVAGVALATILSQAVSAVLVIICLTKLEGSMKLELKALRIYPDKLLKIVKTGIPAGISGALFSVSNVLIQSSINSFGSTVMAGNTAASNIEGFLYTSMNAFHQAALCFAGQNMGARKYSRLNRVMFCCMASVTVLGLVMSTIVQLFDTQLLGLYASSAEVVEYGLIRIKYVCTLYFLCGLMDIMPGQIRGMGYSMLPTIVSLLGACGLRVLWVYTFFAWDPTLETLYISYPISWALTAAIHFGCYVVCRRKLPKEDVTEQQEEAIIS